MYAMMMTWRPPLKRYGQQAELPDSAFAFPAQRIYPLTGADAVRIAIARYYYCTGVTEHERVQAASNIWAAAFYFGVRFEQ